MKVPVKFFINKAFDYMDGKQTQTFRLILEMISTNTEELDISVAILSYMCKTSEMYKFATDLLLEYATKQEIEEFLKDNESMMKIDCREGLSNLKFHLTTNTDFGV